MAPLEAALHARKKIRQLSDMYRPSRCGAVPSLAWSGRYPRLPSASAAPSVLREALARDAERILSGSWRAFGQLELCVDDPPRWHVDYLRGTDLATTECAFRLNHRQLPDGADIKLIWELSRWHPLVRLAMAAYVLNDRRAAAKCVEWLEDWAPHNQPYRGWNWTSALEAGIRLIQFTWIYALLQAHNGASDQEDTSNSRARLAGVTRQILPPHIWFTWRYRSFGSSANNHLIGELAGLILASVAWPAVARRIASLAQLQCHWEREVLAQFNEDGGNREQALNYQIFSWELCWHTRCALLAAGTAISHDVEERLRRAARFYVDLQVAEDPWDYGDSDGAFVTPLFADERSAIPEWHVWLTSPERSSVLDFWWRMQRVDPAQTAILQRSRLPGVIAYTQAGHAMWRRGGWALRVNASPLGYLSTAAHGHFDALHISLWHKGVAMVVDPGTGSYYQNTALRGWLASALAHNGPCAHDDEGPQRLGPFLWANPYTPPLLRLEADRVYASLRLPKRIAERTVCPLADAAGFEIHDRCRSTNGNAGAGPNQPFTVLWQFGPGAKLETVGERSFRITRRGVSLRIDVSPDWTDVHAVAEQNLGSQALAASTTAEAKFAGSVSSFFRGVEWAPYLKLTALPDFGRSHVFRTTFMSAPHP